MQQNSDEKKIRIYREPQKGEFFVVFVDCAQGGSDSNYGQFLSKSKIDVPIVLQIRDVAANMTPVVHQMLEWLYDKTGVQPVVAFERNNGGTSEMSRLSEMNRLNKYRIYVMKKDGTTEGQTTSKELGFNTTSVTRPRMLGDLKSAIDRRALRIYDKETIEQLGTFITNSRGRPEAAPNTHDDAVMSLAGAYQLYLTENPLITYDEDDNQRSGNVMSFWG